MIKPLVTVVIETITSRESGGGRALAADLTPTLDAVGAQSYPAASIEVIVVVDDEIGTADRGEIADLYPALGIVASGRSNYLDAKNAGAAAAKGDFVALLDADCVPDEKWLETLMARFEPNVSAVAGRTRYTGRTWAERVFSVPDFAYVADTGGGQASGFNINNVVFRREVLMRNPFDSRIPRNGGCFFLFHRLRADGARILYEPAAIVSHGNDIAGLGFVRKHFDRGADSIIVYQLDDEQVLKGTPLFRRFGAVAIAAFAGRRILLDWRFLLRHRRQIPIALPSLPFYAMVAAMLRLIELAGAFKAVLNRRPPARLAA